MVKVWSSLSSWELKDLKLPRSLAPMVLQSKGASMRLIEDQIGVFIGVAPLANLGSPSKTARGRIKLKALKVKVLESKWIVVVLEDHLGDTEGFAAVDLERLMRRVVMGRRMRTVHLNDAGTIVQELRRVKMAKVTSLNHVVGIIALGMKMVKGVREKMTGHHAVGSVDTAVGKVKMINPVKVASRGIVVQGVVGPHQRKDKKPQM